MTAIPAVRGDLSLGRTESPGPRVLLATLCLTLPFLPYVVVGRGGDAWQMGPSLALADFALLPVALITGPPLIRRFRQHRLASIELALIAFTLVLVATALVHPSARGLVIAVRLLAVAALAIHVRRSDARTIRVVLQSLAFGAISQGLIAVGQQVRCGPVGLGVLGETAQPFRSWCRSPTGTTRDAYVLAAFGTFAAAAVGVGAMRGLVQRWLGVATLLAGGVVAGLSISRAAALTVATVAVAFIVAAPLRGAVAAMVMLVGFGVAATPLRDRWVGRTANVAVTRDGTRTDDPSNGRGALTNQALRMIAKHPVAGVGPGNYSTALRDDAELVKLAPAAGLLPVHNLPLLVTAESGLPGTVAFAAIVAITARAAVRDRRRWLPLLAAIVPYAMLDIVYWFFAESLVLLAIAIGLIHAPSGHGDDAAS